MKNYEIDIYKISDSISDSSQIIDSKLKSIINQPIYKKILYKFSKNKQMQELEDVSTFFKNKNEELKKHKEELVNLREILTDENSNLEHEIVNFKNHNDYDKELLIQLETKLIINNEILMNEIPMLLEMIDVVINKLAKTLPFIERTIKQRLTINGSLKTLQLVIEKTIELENFSKKLEKENSETIKRMVTSSNELIVNSIDIDYYKDMQKRNEELAKLFAESKEKYYDKINKLEQELSNIINLKNKEK